MNTRTDNNTERGMRTGVGSRNDMDYTRGMPFTPALDEKAFIAGGEAAPLFGARQVHPCQGQKCR